MKKILLTGIMIVVFAGMAQAGGSIFGHHKTRKNNPDGVNSIKAYICGDLQCHGTDITEGSCSDIENSTMKYGVCMCDDGYIMSENKCVKTSEMNCKKAGKKWCFALKDCIDSKNCCDGVSVSESQVCDPDTGVVTDIGYDLESEYACDKSFNVVAEARNTTVYLYEPCTDKNGTRYRRAGCATGYQLSGTDCELIPEYTCDEAFDVDAEARNTVVYLYESCTDKNGTHYKQSGCVTGYQWNGTDCELIPEYACDGSYTLTAELRNLLLYTYESCADKNGIRYKRAGCVTGYQWNGTDCELIPEYACDGSFNVATEARNTTIYLYESCTDKNGIHYKQAGCVTGYQWNGTDCELISEYACDGSFNVVAEARNTTVYLYESCTDTCV